MLSFEELVLEFEEAESAPTPSTFTFVESWLQTFDCACTEFSGVERPHSCNVLAVSFLVLGSE